LQLSNASTLRIAPGGAYNLKTDGDITGSTDTVVVEGTLRKNGGNGLSLISARVNNLGRVEARRGTLSITGAIPDIVGTELSGGLWGVYGTTIVAAALNLNANITSIGLAATVVKSGPNSTFTNIANLGSMTGKFQLLAGAAFATAGNFINNGALTLSPTSVMDVNGNYTQTAAGRLNVQMSGSNLGLIQATGNSNVAGILSVTHSGSQPAINSKLTLIKNDGAMATSGSFNGLPQLATFVVNGMTFQINYNTLTGNNDTVLTRTA
jgi:hypothetical protein